MTRNERIVELLRGLSDWRGGVPLREEGTAAVEAFDDVHMPRVLALLDEMDPECEHGAAAGQPCERCGGLAVVEVAAP